MTNIKYNLCLLLMIFATGCKSQVATEVITEPLEKHLVRFKKSENIKGLAFALFNKDSIIWQKCFGNSTYGYPIDNKTLFSLQSVSKNITAMAVMIALRDGILELDKPIAEYLPDFKVNSCFEENPEDKINLRMLLTHTSGLTHEAPLGNNYDYTVCSYDKHLLSIRETWLKFPAGSRYSYSNLGYDIAASIVENASGMKYNEYLQTKLFGPLNMNSTTVDDSKMVSSINKTEGTISATRPKHLCSPLIGSGAVYTNITDLARYVQLHMNSGTVGKKTIIEKKYLTEMYKIRYNHYGLGTYIDKTNQVIFINHNGSGYGYSASFVWYPEFNIAAVLLCNKQVNIFDICIAVLDEYISRSGLSGNKTVSDEFNFHNNAHLSESAEESIPVNCTTDTIYKDSWNEYQGKYYMVFKGLEFKWHARLAFALGFHPQKVTIEKRDQKLLIKSNYGESFLGEYKPGMFFTAGGEVVDFTSTVPTYKNIELKK
ncbi:MAG: serine hydrolase [Bacteroidales bacterium]|nr:serine hydrolase [Bacteroidales bacterium]